MADFHHLDDARDIWLAVKARFRGNEESKKMRKSMLKQEFSDFKVTESEGLHKGLCGQLNATGDVADDVSNDAAEFALIGTLRGQTVGVKELRFSLMARLCFLGVIHRLLKRSLPRLWRCDPTCSCIRHNYSGPSCRENYPQIATHCVDFSRSPRLDISLSTTTQKEEAADSRSSNPLCPPHQSIIESSLLNASMHFRDAHALIGHLLGSSSEHSFKIILSPSQTFAPLFNYTRSHVIDYPVLAHQIGRSDSLHTTSDPTTLQDPISRRPSSFQATVRVISLQLPIRLDTAMNSYRWCA
ncbi:hypothetical protein Tco_0145788 [Tanacetum coccineum]